MEARPQPRIDVHSLKNPARSGDQIEGDVPAGFRLYPRCVTQESRRAFLEWINRNCLITGSTQEFRRFSFSDSESTIPRWFDEVSRTLQEAGLFSEDAAPNHLNVLRYERNAELEYHTDNPIFGTRLFLINLIASDVHAATQAISYGLRNADGNKSGTVRLNDGDGLALIGKDALSTWEHAVMPVPCLRYSIAWRHKPHRFSPQR